MSIVGITLIKLNSYLFNILSYKYIMYAPTGGIGK